MLLDVQRKRITKVVTSKKVEEMRIEKTTKTKPRSLATYPKRKKKEGSKDHDDEVVYVAIKDESNEDEATTLVDCVNKNDRWIIDSGCSYHMTGDKNKFITQNYYDGNSVRFGNDAPCLITGKGSIKLIKIDFM